MGVILNPIVEQPQSTPAAPAATTPPATLAEQLANVQAAIWAAESAKSVKDSGQEREMPDLQVLYDRETRLLRRINRAANGSRSVAEF